MYFGGREGFAFVVFAVGDEDDGLAGVLVGRESVHGHVDGHAEVGALVGYHARLKLVEVHLGRVEIGGEGQLRLGVAGEDDEAHLVVVQAVDEFFEHKARAVEA